jgi:hypothetical protein
VLETLEIGTLLGLDAARVSLPILAEESGA